VTLLEAIAELIERRCFRGDSEQQLQVAVGALLRRAGPIAVEHPPFVVLFDIEVREEVVGAHGRIDFVVEGRGCGYEPETEVIGVELKVGGPLASVTSQLHRYAQSEDLDALLLVPTRQKHRRVPRLLNGKPVRVAYVSPL